MGHSTSIWPLTYYHAQPGVPKGVRGPSPNGLDSRIRFLVSPIHPPPTQTTSSLSPALPQACCTSNPSPDPVNRDRGADPPPCSHLLEPPTLIFSPRSTQLLQSWRLTFPSHPGRQSRPSGAIGSWRWCPETPQVPYGVHCTAGAGAGTEIRLPEVLGTVRAGWTGCATGPGKCASGYLVPEPSRQAQAGCGGDARRRGFPMRVVPGSPVLPSTARQHFKP